jgi:ADP-ribose pyrophosphatase
LQKPIEDAFRFCPQCGTPAASPGAVPFRCSNCDFAFFFGPVTAVGAILCDRRGEVLLIQRARNPGKGKYGLPGGFVDRGETALEAARREIDEEVGLQIERLDFLTTLPNQYTYRGLTAAVLDIFFTARVESFDSVDHDQREVAGLWIGMPGRAQLDAMAFDSNRRALQAYLA